MTLFDLGQKMRNNLGQSQPRKFRGILTELRTSIAGNISVWGAAAVLPTFALMGGAFDLTRMHLVRTKLQAACDAATLGARRKMGTGNFDAAARAAGEQMFAANFQNGLVGTTDYVLTLTPNGASVDGEASAAVPLYMTAPVLSPGDDGMRNIEVQCISEMRIPNTDVMFVLDVTGSMNCPTTSTTCGNNGNVEASDSKIVGLRTATKCFYEALAKQNTSDPDCTDNPTLPLSSNVHLRFGFVPYSNNVNVGRLLPASYIADEWSYQSVQTNTQIVKKWVAGTPSTGNASSWSSPPSASYNWYKWANNNMSGQSSSPPSLSPTPVGTRRTDVQVATGVTTCNGLAAPNITQLNLDKTPDTAPSTGSWTPSAPVYVDGAPGGNPSDDQQSKTTTTRDTRVSYSYRWRRSNNTSGGRYTCYYELGVQQYDLTRTTPETRPLIWTDETVVSNVQFKPVPLDVRPLKNGTNGTGWPRTMTLPIGAPTSDSFTVSGEASARTFRRLATKTIEWDGCIEERQTHRMADGDTNPTDDWSSIPSSAWDANIADAPTAGATNTQWGPLVGRTTTSLPSGGARTNDMLPNGLVYYRYQNDGSNWNFTQNNITLDATDSGFYAGGSPAWMEQNSLAGYETETACPGSAVNMTRVGPNTGQWTAASFEEYVDDLYAIGSTYHDYGMVWGARLMWPDGMFRAQNEFTPDGGNIERHIVFMTDGQSSGSSSSYGMHGVAWWDRRQTGPSSAPSNTLLTDLIDARLQAVCAQIKNHPRGIKVWVIAFGQLGTTTEENLKQCSSDGTRDLATAGTYFLKATNNAQLVQKFREVAEKISELQLTQ